MESQEKNDMDARVARAQQAAALFRAELGRVCQAGVATPTECANAMMMTAVMTAFVAADSESVGFPDAVKSCISEVTQVINRHVTAFVRNNEGGAT